MSDNVNIIVQDTINEIVVNSAVIVETIDINVQVAVDEVTIIANPNEYIINVNRIIGEQVQSDWNETDDQAPDYIKNKPIIPVAVTKTSDLINDGEDGINPFITLEDIPVSGLTSVGLSMPVAFNVANSPLTSDGTIAVSAAGTSSQYIRGDGQLATLPSGGGGGSSVNYYLNGSIAASVATYKQLSNTAIIGGGTDFTLTGNGLITQFLTDVGNPNRIEIPGGTWNFEMWFSMSSNGGTPKFYVELLKYNGTTFTTIANSSAVPETINGGTTIDLYLTSLAVPTTTLLSTDRLAIRVYIVGNSGGRTATLHTEDNHLCEILTTFSGGVTSLNGLTANTQYLAVGTTGTDFNISSLTDTHTFNLPTASATNRGALTSTDWTAFNGKFTLPSLTSGSVLFSNGTTIAQKNSNFFWDDTNNRLNIGGITSNTARLGIKAPGANPTDIALRVRNSADTADLLNINGTGAISQSSLYNLNGTLSLNTTDTATNDYGPVLTFAGNYTGTTPVYFGMIRAAKSSVGGQRGYMSFHTGASGASLATESMRINWNNNILIGTIVDQGGRLQVKAPGALSTDIALRVRNSADTADLLSLGGTGTLNVGLSGVTSNINFPNTTGGFTNGISSIFGGNALKMFAGGAYLQMDGSSSILLNGNTTVSGVNGNPALIVNQTNNVWTTLADLRGENVTRFRFMTNGNLLIGTTTDVASSKLTVESTTQGFLPPRMTNAQRIAIATPAVGLMVYCTDAVEGLYINKSTGWTYIG